MLDSRCSSIIVVVGAILLGASCSGEDPVSANQPPVLVDEEHAIWITGCEAHLFSKPTNPWGLAGGVFRFHSWGFDDPEEQALTYTWDFGDGGTATVTRHSYEDQWPCQATHVYASAGTYVVTLEVSDGELSTQVTDTVDVGDVAGTWEGTVSHDVHTRWARLVLSQTGMSLHGDYSDGLGLAWTLDGMVVDETNVPPWEDCPGCGVPQWGYGVLALDNAVRDVHIRLWPQQLGGLSPANLDNLHGEGVLNDASASFVYDLTRQ